MHRRTLIKGGVTLIAATIAGARDGGARPAPVLPGDEGLMQVAIDEAAKAEFPFGAVIVKNGELLAQGHNRTRIDRHPNFPRIIWTRGTQGRHPLHVGRALLHVHGRYYLVRYRQARLRRLDRSTRDQDRPDHAFIGGRGVEGAIRNHRHRWRSVG